MFAFDLMTFRTITNMHIGCGSSGGAVDLPVAREKTTTFPVMPASGVRGVMRDNSEEVDASYTIRLFGADKGDESAGCAIPPEGRLLLFPVQSSHEVFQWITCPFVLKRFAEDCAIFSNGTLNFDTSNITTVGSSKFMAAPQAPDKIYLMEFEFAKEAGGWDVQAWLDEGGITLEGVDSNKVVLINDEDFKFLADYGNDVVQHNRLDIDKTVVGGAFFSIEYVPAQSVFYGFLGAAPERKNDHAGEGLLSSADALVQLKRQMGIGLSNPKPVFLQLGGKESTARGFVKASVHGIATPASDVLEEA